MWLNSSKLHCAQGPVFYLKALIFFLPMVGTYNIRVLNPLKTLLSSCTVTLLSYNGRSSITNELLLAAVETFSLRGHMETPHEQIDPAPSEAPRRLPKGAAKTCQNAALQPHQHVFADRQSLYMHQSLLHNHAATNRIRSAKEGLNLSGVK